MATHDESTPLHSADDLRALARIALDASAADETEVLLGHNIEATTRFADDGITQNVLSAEGTLTVRAMVGRRSGRATTTSFLERDIKRTVARAHEAARVATEDPEALPLPGPQTYAQVSHLDPAALAQSPGERADVVARAMAKVRAASLRPAGTYVIDGESQAIANSRGLFAHHVMSTASFALSAMSDSSSGWAERLARGPAGVDAELVTSLAIDKALRGRDPGDLEPGDHVVVLEPAAVTDFLLFLGQLAANGLAFNEDRSLFSGRLGTKLFAEPFTLADDVTHPLAQGAPFDGEGMPRRPVTLVERGVAQGVVHDRRTAAAAGTDSTGHGLPQPNSTGPIPQNLVMAEGDQSLEELIASTPRGVLVTRFHYTNVIDPKRLVLTGMTRNGLFLIEHGKVTRPIKNLRFTETAERLFGAIEGVSRERLYLSSFFGGNYVVPALKARHFAFSSGTEF